MKVNQSTQTLIQSLMDYPKPLGSLDTLQSSVQPQLKSLATVGTLYCQLAGLAGKAVKIAICPLRHPLAAVQKWHDGQWLIHISSTLIAADYGKATHFAVAHELGHIINGDCERSPEDFEFPMQIEHKANLTGIELMTKARDRAYALEGFTAATRLSHAVNPRMSEYQKRTELVGMMQRELKLDRLEW